MVPIDRLLTITDALFGVGATMIVMNKSVALDDAAEELFRELDGIHADYVDEVLRNEEERLDRWRGLIVDAVYYVSSFFFTARFQDGVKKQSLPTDSLLSIIQQLMDIPGARSGLNVRFRGLSAGDDAPLETDYLVQMGGLTADVATAEIMAQRGGVTKTHISRRLARTFKILHQFGVISLYMEFPSVEKNGQIAETWRESLCTALSIISQYNHALNAKRPIILHTRGRKHLLPLVLDEAGEADINLTLLAGVNDIRPDLMAELVRKAAKWMNDTETSQGGVPYLNVYDALFGNRGLRDKLTKPPIEINNLCRLSDGSDPMVLTNASAKVSRVLLREFKNAPRQAARVFQSVYGGDYKSIGSNHLGMRLKDANALLNTLDSDDRKGMQNEVFSSMRKRFDDIHEGVFDDFTIQEDGLKLQGDHQIENLGKLNSRLNGFISYYKGRSVTRRKLKNIRRNDVQFTDRDYKTLSVDFGISPQDAKALVQLLKNCFNDDGRFRRSVFESHISDFARFETKAFKLLWGYLKETPNRRDRVAFINSLQLLIARMDQPLSAIKMLLEDIWENPDAVPSDQEAFMLCNLLLRTYSKELDVDIEVTPEEVLRVKDGLNRSLAKETAGFVSLNYDRLLNKVSAIGEGIMSSLTQAQDRLSLDRLRTLFFVEREMVIFWGLIGGSCAKTFLTSAVHRYDAAIMGGYLSDHGAFHLSPIIRNMIVIIRGIERLATENDLILLERLSRRESQFQSISSGEDERRLTRRLMECVNNARESIKIASWRDLYADL